MSAEIRWGYHLAARMTGWSFDGVHIRATVTEADPFALSQSGLQFVMLRDGRPDGQRPIAWMNITDGAFVARLGPKE